MVHVAAVLTCRPLLVLRRGLSRASPIPSRKMFLMMSFDGFLSTTTAGQQAFVEHPQGHTAVKAHGKLVQLRCKAGKQFCLLKQAYAV